MGDVRSPGQRPGASAYSKPADWDPVHPPLKVCIHCYAPAKQVYVWKWGVNWVCDSDLTIAKKAIGFAGIFKTQVEGEAYHSFLVREAEKKRK